MCKLKSPVSEQKHRPMANYMVNNWPSLLLINVSAVSLVQSDVTDPLSILCSQITREISTDGQFMVDVGPVISWSAIEAIETYTLFINETLFVSTGCSNKNNNASVVENSR